jgi:hypothetical protein
MAILDVLKALLPAAATVGGYALKRSAQNEADEKRARVIASIAGRNDDAMRQQLAITDNQVERYTPQRRLPALDQAERLAVQRFEGAVTAPDAVAAGPQYGGRVSGAYSSGKAQRMADELTYATKLAHLMGRAAAPADLALEESFSNADAALARGGVKSDLRGDLRIGEQQLGAIEPSGGKMLAGDLLSMGGLMAGRQDGALDFGIAREPGSTGPSSIPVSASPQQRLRMGNAVPGIAAAPGTRPRLPAAPGAPGTTSYWTGGRR